MDVGDRYSHLCQLDTETGDALEEARIATNPATFERRFAGSARVAIEAGTHSPWISMLLEESGNQVLVANARKLRLIYGEGRKTYRLDAENLARFGAANTGVVVADGTKGLPRARTSRRHPGRRGFPFRPSAARVATRGGRASGAARGSGRR